MTTIINRNLKMDIGKETCTPTRKSRRPQRKARPSRLRKNRSTNRKKQSLKSRKMMRQSEASRTAETKAWPMWMHQVKMMSHNTTTREIRRLLARRGTSSHSNALRAAEWQGPPTMWRE